MPTDVDVCNRALQMIGSRNKVSSLTSDSEEAQNCNLLYAQVRDQILSAAHWNFARTTVRLDLLKSLPGTPESPINNATQWVQAYPQPPWLYSYRYPSNCMQFRYLYSQTNLYQGVPIFSTQQQNFVPFLNQPPERFAIARELVGPFAAITNITRANPAVVTAASHGFANSNTVYITSVVGMTEVNNLNYTIANVTTNTFSIGVNSTAYSAYILDGISGGIVINQTQATTEQITILSNARTPTGTFTAQVTNLNLWSSTAIQALVSAMAGFLAIPLTQDRGLARGMIDLANKHILDARASDGNEGYTIQGSTPDWIAARESFYSYDSSLPGMLIAPYPPLLSI